MTNEATSTEPVDNKSSWCDRSTHDEIDRNARAYGWEVGKGRKLATVVSLSDDNPFKGKDWRDKIGYEEEESNLVSHARRELDLLGEEPDIIEQYLNVIRAFSAMEHSGSSAMVAISVIHELLQFKPLKPLTNNPDEWLHHTEETWGEEGGVWQSKRNSEAFSNDGGKTYYLLSERDVDLEVTPIHTSEDVLSEMGLE